MATLDANEWWLLDLSRKLSIDRRTLSSSDNKAKAWDRARDFGPI